MFSSPSLAALGTPWLAELAIVGAGPAGLAAAVEAARHGLHAVLVDAYPQPGGQYFKQPPPEFPSERSGRRGASLQRARHGLAPTEAYHGVEGQALFSALAQAPGDRLLVLTDTVVWGIFAEQNPSGYLLCLYGPMGTPRRLRTKTVILAPGAYDRPVPFPGWTQPGVMTAGAAQALIKSQRVLPGRRVVLSGSGPLQWALASQLIDGGAQVVALLDANPFPARRWRRLGPVWGQWSRLLEGLGYWQTMRRAGVSIRWGHAVFRAEGDGHLERLVIGPTGGVGCETVAADTLCLGYGFVPSVQLSLQAGCEHDYCVDLGGIVPVRDEWLQTSLPGLFAAGDAAGICGKDAALLEGQLAAVAAARYLGRLSDNGSRAADLRRGLVRQRRFAQALADLFPFPVPLWDLVRDDTIVCRCEEVTAEAIRDAVLEGATTLSAVKALTRAGMGRCQGRNCGNLVAHTAHAVAQATSRTFGIAPSLRWGLCERRLGSSGFESRGWFTPRPPVVPVPLAGLVAD